MKKLILYSILLFLTGAVTVTAQDNKNLWLGGSLNLNVITNGGHTTSRIGIAPEIGYRFSDKFGVGTEVGYYYQKFDYDDFNSDAHTLKLAPFLRCYLLEKDWGYVFIDNSIGYLHTRSHGDGTNSLMIGIRPGIGIRANEYISFLGRLGNLAYSYHGGGSAHMFELDVDLSYISLGMNFHF